MAATGRSPQIVSLNMVQRFDSCSAAEQPQENAGAPTNAQMVAGMDAMYQELKNQHEELTRLRAAEAERAERSQFLNQSMVNAFFKGRGASGSGKGAEAVADPNPGKGQQVTPTPVAGTLGDPTAGKGQKGKPTSEAGNPAEVELQRQWMEYCVNYCQAAGENTTLPTPNGPVPVFNMMETVARGMPAGGLAEQFGATGVAPNFGSWTNPPESPRMDGLNAFQEQMMNMMMAMMNQQGIASSSTSRSSVNASGVPRTLQDKERYRRSLKQGDPVVNFPPAESRNGYRYYFGEEHLVRKGIFCGSARFEKEFPDGMGWAEMRGHIWAYGELEQTVHSYFRTHPKQNMVEVYR